MRVLVIGLVLVLLATATRAETEFAAQLRAQWTDREASERGPLALAHCLSRAS
jgi:hypothetical protein